MRLFFLFFYILFVCPLYAQNDSLKYNILLRIGLNVTHLKGYERFLGEKFIKSEPSLGYETNLGIGVTYKNIKLNTALGFKKSKTNYITLSESLNDIALFKENFLRIDLLLYKFYITTEIGYHISNKNAVYASILQSLNTYHRATIIYNKSLENPDPNQGDGVYYTNFDLHSNKAETIVGISWEYKYSKKWTLLVKASTSIIII
ncbi:MAG: hypothetical protein IPL98_12675 [Saprospiraceae bacterium]|nr:hypothetical protein [Saprospiraceae bacterium]